MDPQAEEESIFRTFLEILKWKVEVVDLAVLDCRLRTTSKKRSSTFFRKKVHPRLNPGYAYGNDNNNNNAMTVRSNVVIAKCHHYEQSTVRNIKPHSTSFSHE